MQLSYETQRLCLRMLPDHAAGAVLQFYEDNKEVFERYEMERAENFYTEEYQKTLLRCDFNMAVKQLAVRYWVFLREEPQQIIGTFSFHNIRRQNYQSCELGYKFAPAFWGKGYARESVARGIRIAFEELYLNRIEALVQPENEPSIRLLRGLAFQPEGIRRQNIKLHGIWRDHAVYSLLASDWGISLPDNGTSSQILRS